MLARHLEAISGKAPGLAGSALRQHVVAIGVGRRLCARCGLPDRAQTGQWVTPGLRSCAKGKGGSGVAQVPAR